MEERQRGALLRSAMTTQKQNINYHHTPHTILKPTSMPNHSCASVLSEASRLMQTMAYLSVICHVTGGTPDTLLIEFFQLFCQGGTIMMPILQARKDVEDFKP